MSNQDNAPLVGGRYIVRDGKRELVEEPTKDHPDGNRARDEGGKPIAAPDETHANKPAAAAPPAPAPVEPPRRPRRTADEGAA